MLPTQVSPVAHAGHDDDTLPKVAGDVTDLADDQAGKEPNGLVRERDQEQRSQRRYVRRREGGDDVGEDERRERDVHRDLGGTPRGRLGEVVDLSEDIAGKDRKEPGKTISRRPTTDEGDNGDIAHTS